MLKKLQQTTLTSALCMGGYIGWLMTVMYICEKSLHYYRDDSLLASVNITFLAAAVITSAVIVAVLTFLDFEGLLSDKLLRWLPGIFMAESGIALSLSNAATMTVYSAITGCAAALGMLAVLSRLLSVKVGQRIISVGFALALGGVIRLLAGLILVSASQTGLVAVSVVIGVIAALTVHSEGFTDTDGPLVSLAEAPAATLLKKIPLGYLFVFLCTGAFYFAFGHVEDVAVSKMPDGFTSYDLITMLAFIVTALLIARFVKLHRLPLILTCSAGIASAAAIFAGLPYLTAGESSTFALVSYPALAAFKLCVYMFVILFSLDRPHPLFFAMLGYTAAIGGELAGTYLSTRIVSDGLRPYIWALLLLIPVGGLLMAASMRRYGLTGEKLDQRHKLSRIIRRKSAELDLFDREEMMVQSIVLDGCGIDELSGKLLFSHNTVKVLLRPVFAKFGVADIDGLREYFARLSDDEAQFLAQVQAAEQEKKAQERRDRTEQLLQSLRDIQEEKEQEKAAKVQEKAEMAAETAVVDAVLIDSDEDAEYEESESEEYDGEEEYDESEEYSGEEEYDDSEADGEEDQ